MLPHNHYLYQDPVFGVVNEYPLTSKGLLLDTWQPYLTNCTPHISGLVASTLASALQPITCTGCQKQTPSLSSCPSFLLPQGSKSTSVYIHYNISQYIYILHIIYTLPGANMEVDNGIEKPDSSTNAVTQGFPLPAASSREAKETPKQAHSVSARLTHPCPQLMIKLWRVPMCHEGVDAAPLPRHGDQRPATTSDQPGTNTSKVGNRPVGRQILTKPFSQKRIGSREAL